MELEVKKPEHIVPSYSLTGDLLSYLRCRLQYRYYNGSSLPPSRPVQLWFGEFLHGTLELAFEYWSESHLSGQLPPDFPWPCTKREWRQGLPDWDHHDIGKFANIVEETLHQQGKQARSRRARDSAYQRVELAVNQLGPYLFPLITSAETKVIGTRPVPTGTIDLRCDNYEIHGVIDVLTNVTLSQAPDHNLIRQVIQSICPDLNGEYEVIVDYKGSRRPLTSEPLWDQEDWQIQTYAWLREQQPDALSVAAGILIYINELTPGDEEMRALKQGLLEDTADVKPNFGSHDQQLIRMWRVGMDTSQLSLPFRLRRAVRVIPVSRRSIDSALSSFDEVVRQAEERIISEVLGQDIIDAWSPNSEDSATCAACDFRHFCPNRIDRPSGYPEVAPTAP